MYSSWVGDVKSHYFCFSLAEFKSNLAGKVITVFSCKWWWVCDNKARSSAKSRSSNGDVVFHLIPLGASSVVFLITQSMTILKRRKVDLHGLYVNSYKAKYEQWILKFKVDCLYSKWSDWQPWLSEQNTINVQIRLSPNVPYTGEKCEHQCYIHLTVCVSSFKGR